MLLSNAVSHCQISLHSFILCLFVFILRYNRRPSFLCYLTTPYQLQELFSSKQNTSVLTRRIEIHGSLNAAGVAYVKVLSDIRLSNHEQLQSCWSAPQSKFTLLWLQPLLRVQNVFDSILALVWKPTVWGSMMFALQSFSSNCLLVISLTMLPVAPTTVIPRLTKIIRSGITFVSRNLR